MKSKGQILQKIKQASYRHLKRELTRLLSQRSFNCQNNRLLKLPQDVGEIRICSLDCQTCDPASDDRAQSCGSFEPMHDKDEIRESLKRFFLERPVNELAVRFPDVAALLWTILDDSDPQRGDLLPDSCPTHSLNGVPLWVDKEEDVKGVGEYLSEIISNHEAFKELSPLLEEAGFEGSPVSYVKSLLKENSELTKNSSRLASELMDSKKKLSELVSEIDSLTRLEVQAQSEAPSWSMPGWWKRMWS